MATTNKRTTKSKNEAAKKRALKKQKEQKINKAEEELNQQVFGNMKIEDSSKRDYYHKERYNKGKNQKFKYNPDEFPEL